ncbi:MAG: Trypsin [Ferruginibacter sp.]|nr:Trypsin [Ferruginibacter sp.]
MAAAYSDNIRWHLSQHHTGQLLGNSMTPEAGLLLVTAPSGYTEYCSAQAIAPEVIISAAHCFCDEALNADQCAPRLASLSATYFSPTNGVRQIQMPSVAVQENYRFPGQHQTSPPSPLADIALAHLDRSVANFALVAAAPQNIDDQYLTSSSFGWLMVSNDENGASPTGLTSLTRYNVGVGQTVAFPDVDDAAACGAAPDILCVVVKKTVTTDPYHADAGTCGGDSGGAMYQWNGSHRSIVAISSSNDDGSKCQSSELVFSQVAFFTDLTKYISWIAQYISSRSYIEDVSNTGYCNDLVFDGSFEVSGSDARSLSIVPFDAVDQSLTKPVVNWAGNECVTIDGREFVGWFCELGPTSVVRYSSNGGHQSIRVCPRRAN